MQCIEHSTTYRINHGLFHVCVVGDETRRRSVAVEGNSVHSNKDMSPP